jgi:hypothetical protein
MVDVLKFLNEIDFWSLLTFWLAVITWLMWFLPQRRYRDLNFTFFVAKDGNRVNNNILFIKIRNQSDSTIVLSSPYIITNRQFISEFADGNSPTHEYELKFIDHDNKLSRSKVILKHEEGTTTNIALRNDIKWDDFWKTSSRGIGKFACYVTILSEKPKSVRISMPIRNISNRIINESSYDKTDNIGQIGDGPEREN